MCKFLEERFFASLQPDTVASLGDFQEGCKSNSMVVLFTKLDSWVGRYLLQKQEGIAVAFDSLRGTRLSVEARVPQGCA